MHYEFYNKMNYSAYLNLLRFKIAQQKQRKKEEERERMRSLIPK